MSGAASERGRRLIETASRIGQVWLLPAVVLAFLALFATLGRLDRHPIDPVPEYLQFTHMLATQPVRVLATFAVPLTIYCLIFVLARRLLGRALDLPRESFRAVRWRRACASVTDWVLARWWRISLLLLALWSPLIVMQFPGTSNADFILQIREVLDERARTNYQPYDVYPIGHYLVPDGDVLLSNHHNAFLTLFYGTVMGKSLELFGSFEVGFIALTMSQLAFTLIAFGRAASLLARDARSDLLRIGGVVLLILSGWPIALWAIALAKNPLFAAAFVWILALAIRHVRDRTRISALMVLEWALVTVVALNSAKFASPIVMALFVLVCLWRRDWRAWIAAALALLLPALVMQAALRAAVDQEWIIGGDKLAGKGMQIQSLAYTIKERPEGLSPEDRKKLERIFDVDMMVEVYNPRTMAPIRGAGYRDGAYKWRTVTREDAAEFDGIWLRVAKEEPDMMLNGMLLKSYKFFDPLTRGADNWPTVRADDNVSAISVDGEHFLNDDFMNLEWREASYEFWSVAGGDPWFKYSVASPFHVVVVILLATLAISLRRPSAWIWALPLALHAGVLIMSPLDMSGRYSLGITYFLPFAVLALAASRQDFPPEPDEPRDTDATGQSVAPSDQGEPADGEPDVGDAGDGESVDRGSGQQDRADRAPARRG